MIKIQTNLTERIVSDDSAVSGDYSLEKGEHIIKAIVYDCEHVPDFAFVGCKELVEVELAEGVLSLGRYVFKGADNLKKVILPYTLQKIDCDSFEGCPASTFIDAIPEVLHLVEAAKAEKEEKTRIAKERMEQQKRENEQRRIEHLSEIELRKLERQEADRKAREEAERKERERIESLRKEREEGNVPQNEYEVMLLRLFGDKAELYDMRNKHKELTYSFEVSDVLYCSELSATVKMELAPSGSRKRNKVSVNLYAWTDDFFNFDEDYCEAVEELRQSLESIGMKSAVKGIADCDDDRDIFTINLSASKLVSKKEIESFLSLLKDVLNREGRTVCSKDGEELISEWFPMLEYNGAYIDWKDDEE